MGSRLRQFRKEFENSFFLQEFKSFFQKGDMVLLLLCLTVSAFSLLIVASTTNGQRTISMTRCLILQVAAVGIGVLLYAIMSSVDLEFFSEHRVALTLFGMGLILLLIPFGTDNGSGNRSWLEFPLLPFNIQPAEICKVSYILVTASVMSSHQNKISSIRSVFHMVLHLALLIGPNMLISRDLGVSLIFVFIFAGMAFAGGVKLIWFLLAGGAITLAVPTLWPHLTLRQRNRIMIIFDPTIDPEGLDPRYHTKQSLLSLTGGGMTGQGLFNGTRTQAGALNAQHTDFIFSAIGEELGYAGCILVLLMLTLIIARCIWVGVHSKDYMRRLVCFGAAAALVFQVCVNAGMCMGVVPIIGITLPLVSYGASSVVSIYAMLGLVSGVHARPAPRSHERYIRPPL